MGAADSTVTRIVKGATNLFKRGRQGLYHGKRTRFGNTVSESGNRTRRRWLPNVHKKKLYSAALDEQIRVPVTCGVLRKIDRLGGLDAYLLKTPEASLASDVGIALKRRIQDVVKARRKDAQGLGELASSMSSSSSSSSSL